MSDLTAFLLARITQDEAVAPGLHRVLCMRIACDREGCIWGEDEDDAMQRERVCTCGYPARVLAECEARRRIVEKARRADQAFSQHVNPASSAAVFALTEVLQFLALPYADHPNYRDEWKP